MEEVSVGIIGLGNVGSGTLAILAETADQIALKLGFRLRVTAVCSRGVASQSIPQALGPVFRTPDWRQVLDRPDVDIVAELVGGTTAAAEIIDAAIAHKESVVTANKELMALCGPEIWDRAIRSGINLAMEASVAGGIPIHAVLREGISGDRVVALSGILNGTSNFILTEMEKRGDPLETVLAEAQRLGANAARADPVGAPGADPLVDHSGWRAGRLQRRLGEGAIRPGHVLLRPRRRSPPYRRGCGQR